MLQFLMSNYDLLFVTAEVLFIAVVAIVTGFCLARWMYKSEAASQNTILQQEIMRLRRKLAERETTQSVVERHHHRLRRQLRENNIQVSV